MTKQRKNSKNFGGAARREFLTHLHIPLQRKLFRYAGPATIAIYVGLFVYTYSWQALVGLASALLLEVAWLISFRLMWRKVMDASVYVAAISTLLFVALTAILIPSTMPGAALSGVATLVYCALYSKRHTITIALAFGILIVVCELSFYLMPFSVLEIGTLGRLFSAIAMGLVVIPLITLFLLKSRRANLNLFYKLKEKNTLQASLLKTITKTRPIVDRAVGDVRNVTNLFAEQAREQASAAAEISEAVGEVSSISEAAAAKAEEARDVALGIQFQSERSSQRLERVEQGFREVIALIDAARRVVVELDRDIIKLDKILTSNLEIGRQIRFLAINTAIQAAKAGRDFGGGFRVIAAELRQLIRDTDQNLSRTQNLLIEIRDQSRDSSEKIKGGSEGLLRFFDELHLTADAIENSAENMASTVNLISRIASAAKQQLVGMKGIGIAMMQIDEAAADLSGSASGLIDSIDQIVNSQNELGNALRDGYTSYPRESKPADDPFDHHITKPTENRKDFVVKLYLPIQRLLSFVIGPALVVLFLILAVRSGKWQDFVLLVAALGMNIAWLATYKCYKMEKLMLGNTMFVAFSFGFTTLSGLFLPGVIPMVMIANIGVMAYGVFFTGRYALICAVCASGSYLLCELGLAFHFVSPRSTDHLERLVIQIALALILIPIITLFFRRSQAINDELFESQEKQGREQEKIINTIREIYPVIGRAITQIGNTSDQFNTQASEQAASAAEIYTTVSEVRAASDESARTAADTQRTTKETEEDSSRSYRRLKTIEQEFRVVEKLIGEAGEEARALAHRAGQIEEILGFNAEISQQVKILAVNAGIEAAKAGRFKGGFRVVALKLREMIQRTDENLKGVRALLDGIRVKTWESTTGIERGKKRLGKCFGQLQKVSLDLEKSTSRFATTTEQVAGIARAAREQQVGIQGVSVAMEQIDRTASQLSKSGVILNESMTQIESTQASFQEVLEADLSL